MTSPNNSALAGQPPTVFTYLGQQVANGPILGGVLIGDYVNDSTTTPAGSSYNIPTVSLATGVPVSAQLELQSTTGALLVMRMTTTQRNAMITVVNGMMIYNITSTAFQFYQNGAWVSLSAGAGGVVGPGSSLVNQVATYADSSGTTLLAAPTTIDSSGNILLVNTLQNAVGTAAAPSYTFTARTNTGVYSSAANTLDFATDGTRQLSVGGAIVAVNYAQIQGAIASSPVLFNALGTDTNINIQLVPKGAGAVVHPVGATATPSVTFAGRTDTGMWSSAASTVDFSSTGGRNLQIVDSAGTTVNYLTITGAATNGPVIVGATGSDAAVNIRLFPKGTTTGQVVMPVGAVATPAVTFLGDLVTGIWHSAANTIDFSGNSVRQFQVSSTASAVDFISAIGCATNVANAALQPSLVASGSDTVVDVAVVGKGTASGLAVLANSAGGGGSVKFWNPAGTFFTQLIGGAVTSASKTFTLPIADASANADATTLATPLSSNGSGVLSFADTGLKYAAGSLTLAQVLAAYTTPIELIPAPGANLMVVINNFVIEYIYGSAAYANGGAVYLEYGNTAHGTNYATPVTAIPAAVLTGLGASTAISTTGTINTTTGLAISVAGNAAINYTNATANFITGTGGTARYAIWYSIIPVT